ncbi:MAG: AAC(3) family N-acetyltransferase [Gammaproteobacteria bacterium]|nr:AAC(3) family N-acetyltransferase [Gammaproteobacteria bacterium]
MKVDQTTIASAATRMGFRNSPLMVHSSLASFGPVQGGAQAVLNGLLEGGRTILVPSFSWTFGIPPPDDETPMARNGVEDGFLGPTAGIGRVYTPRCGEIDRDMGAIAAALLNMHGAMRGTHPLNSFAAVGPDARTLVGGQTELDVYAPIRALARRGGDILLMGVGLEAMTALHAAEELAGRRLFRRWANGPDGDATAVAVGGCSRGFGAFDEVLAVVERHECVGNSVWRAFSAQATLALATKAIRASSDRTRCGRDQCVRCADAIAGGPLLP